MPPGAAGGGLRSRSGIVAMTTMARLTIPNVRPEGFIVAPARGPGDPETCAIRTRAPILPLAEGYFDLTDQLADRKVGGSG